MAKFEVRKARPESDSWWIVEVATERRRMGPFATKTYADRICAGAQYNGRKSAKVDPDAEADAAHQAAKDRAAEPDRWPTAVTSPEAAVVEPPMPEGFVMLAGEEARKAENASRDANVAPSWTHPGSKDSTSLVSWQENAGRAWRSVEVVSTLRGFSVRATSGLDNFALLHVASDFQDAVRWARAWVAEAPASRYAYTRTYVLRDIPGDVVAMALAGEVA